MTTPRIVSVQIGAARALSPREGEDKPPRTAFGKAPVGAARVLRERLEGDEQVVATVHGGPDRAVLAYAAAHYARWREEYPAHAFAFGAFAENLTVDGLDEGSVCIGDRYRAGGAVIEVTVPRTPCGMISRATGVEGLCERARATTRVGWLHRVLTEGELRAGDPMELLARPHPAWTVARAADVAARIKQRDRDAVDDARALAALPELAAAWRERLPERVREALEGTSASG